MDLQFRELTNDENQQTFFVVGQAVSPTSTAEFLIVRSWTYGEIVQTAILFLILVLGLFAFLFAIFKKKRKNL